MMMMMIERYRTNKSIDDLIGCVSTDDVKLMGTSNHHHVTCIERNRIAGSTYDTFSTHPKSVILYVDVLGDDLFSYVAHYHGKGMINPS
jgi:hypothetical protein